MAEFNMDKKKLAYILKSFKMCRNDYYKKLKKDKNRELLILDKPINVNEDILVIDTLISIEEDCFDGEHKSIEDITSNEKLLGALQGLTNRQKEILYYVYIENLTIAEVANLLDTSRQVINKTHNLSLSKMKKKLEV